MWMVGSSNGCSELSMSDSFNGRKLRPLIPKPNSPTSPKRRIKSSITTHPCITCIHATHLFAFNRDLATASEQSKRELEEPPMVSSRWNPTREQLQALEDMYRRGTRTPTAEQIQQIATQLRRFGKIEGKNVFYWFQNHKARERQKRRRELEMASSDQEQQGDTGSLEREDSAGAIIGLRRTGFEVEETKNWAPPSNCSTLSEESVSIHRAAVLVAESCRTDGWIQLEERELQQRRNTVERHATCQKKEMCCPSPLINAQLINTNITTATQAAKAARITNNPKLLKVQNQSKLLTEDEDRETQTLELFPLRSDDFSGIKTCIDTNFTPYKFFEFLPLKKY